MARMSLDTAIRLSAEVKGGGNIDRVKKSLQDLGKNSQVTAREMSTLRAATFQFARANDSTIAGIRSSIGAFRGLQEQAKIGSREFQRYGAEIQRLEDKLRGLDGTAAQANTRIAGMAAVAGRLIAAYAGIESVRFVFGSAAELESQTRSLEVLTGSAEQARDIVQQLQQLGAVTPFTSAELIDTAKRLQAFGVETEKVVEITRRLADVSGATGAELAGLATAYGQVQAKGRLQGEELLQFQERGVALQQILRKEYGLTGVEFQKALEKGQISAEAVEYALRKLTETGGKYANGAIAQSDTLRGRMSTLTDSVQVLAQKIGKTLDPVFKWALTQATAVVSQIQRLIDEANNAGGARDREARFARNADAFVRRMGLNPFTQQGMMAEMRQRNIEQQRADYELARQTARTAAPPVALPGAPSTPALPPLSGGGTTASSATAGSGGGRRSRAAAAGPRTDQNRAIEQLRQEREAVQRQYEAFNEQRAQSAVQLLNEKNLMAAIGDEQRRRLELDIEIDNIAEQHNEKLRDLKAIEDEVTRLRGVGEFAAIRAGLEREKEQRTALAQARAEQDINDLVAERVRMMQQLTSQAAEPAVFQTQGMRIEAQIATLKNDLAEMTSIATVAGRSAEAIGGAFGDAFRDLISGAASARQVLGGFFEDVARGFAQMASEIIAKQMAMIALQTILKALGAVAGGGSTFAAGGQGGSISAFGFDPIGFTTPSTGIPFFPRALGGPTASGQPYKVGENGPELFVPYQAGSIIPAEATEALQAINNASMRGLRVPFQGSSSSTTTTLREVPFQRGMEGLAVPFQRGGAAGGGMGGGASWDSPIRFESVVINSEELVTRKQAEEIGRRSEQRGAALAQKRMVNNPTTRRQAGIG